MSKEKLSPAELLLESLGSKPSKSEENGLNSIPKSALVVFSPGISSAGFAEIRMAQQNPDRRIITTTINQEGLDFAQETIEEVGVDNQITAKLEDLREMEGYQDESVDFIYARLVLHYLNKQDLDVVMAEFYKMLKPGGKMFIVVRSANNVPKGDPYVEHDSETMMTSMPHYLDESDEPTYMCTRYFHTVETMTQHLEATGFRVTLRKQYDEQLYTDFKRENLSDILDNVIEIHAEK